MKNLKNYLLFKKFMMPFVLQFLFWGGIGGVLYGSYWLYTNENWGLDNGAGIWNIVNPFNFREFNHQVSNLYVS